MSEKPTTADASCERPATPLATSTDAGAGASANATAAASGQPSSETTAPESRITIDDFSRVQLRVAQIISAERVERSEKLVKLQVDIGEERPRQILAGIAKHYAPEALVGRKIAVVANLKPAKLMGQVSEGMLLAASDESGNLELLSVGPAIPPGSVIR